MSRAATLIGLLGAVLGLASGAISGCLGFGLVSLSGVLGFSAARLPALLIEGLFAVATPAVALAGSLQATRRPRLAAILLTACGVVAAIIIRSRWQALLYSIAGILAVLGEKEARVAPAWPKPQVPPRTQGPYVPQPAQAPQGPRPVRELPAAHRLPLLGAASGVSAIIAGLAAGFWAVSHSGGAEGVGFGFLILGFIAAVFSGVGLVGALITRGLPWEGSVLMVVSGLLAALPSLVIFAWSLPPAFGLWGLASNLCLAWVGFRTRPVRSLPATRPTPRPAPPAPDTSVQV